MFKSSVSLCITKFTELDSNGDDVKTDLGIALRSPDVIGDKVVYYNISHDPDFSGDALLSMSSKELLEFAASQSGEAYDGIQYCEENYDGINISGVYHSWVSLYDAGFSAISPSPRATRVIKS